MPDGRGKEGARPPYQYHKSCVNTLVYIENELNMRGCLTAKSGKLR